MVMPSLLSYARSTFWMIGIVEIVFGLYMAVAVRPTLSSRPHATALLIAIGLLLASMGALSCLAAKALSREKRFTRPLVAINSILSLLLFPFGTVAGLVGLYWCWSPKIRELKPRVEDFEYKSKPGDGTHRWVQKAVPIVGLLIVMGSLFAADWWGYKHGLPRNTAMSWLLLLILCEFISTFCHELGHTVAAWAVGMRLAGFTVGPFTVEKRAGKWKFMLSLGSLLGGGAVATVPLHLGDLRRRMAFEIAGGPVASLLTAFVALMVLLAMPGSAWEMWWSVPAVVGAISAGAAVLNLIPFGFAAGFSDGALLVQLLREGPFADLRVALKMVGATTEPTRGRGIWIRGCWRKACGLRPEALRPGRCR
jgi:hypothetical protein